ncbi:putative AP2/B3-like transcriptional factor family protein [Tripterygium wilfordii]|uniref:Putative AP2/B3-like transcriptional factor family protein n=1 Tax=Tripterygium wilfordii TaxID=458696 RepID=A0A7J7D5I9_TRIWF|nr:putative AP2/B3-like transcriptional factor family protein [Tripterygium wilfordii]
MDSTSSRDHDASFTSKRPHFFKIILEDTVREGRIAIPRKFVSKYGSSLSKSLLLRVRRGGA